MEEKKEQPDFRVTDRRFWVQENAPQPEAAPEQRYPSFVEELKARTDAAEQRLKEKIKKLEAENEAFRARLTKEMEKRLEAKKLRLFCDLLEIADNFERALKAAEDNSTTVEARLAGLKEGVHLNQELFFNKLKAAGIEPLQVLDQPFNPHESEAVGVLAVEDPTLDQYVVEVVQRGFRCGDQLLRPARVRVGQFSGTQS